MYEGLLGNKNAEKWNFEKAKALLEKALELSKKKRKFKNKIGQDITGYEYDFIGEIARELDIFRELLTLHIPKRFPELESIKNQLLRNMEANCYSNTKKGIIREATGIVNLKSNHKWKDRVDATSNDKEIKQIVGMEIK